MNHLQFQVAIGTIAVTWTSQGLLSRIDWYYTRPVSSGDRPEGQIAHPWSALSRVEIPPKVVDVLERMRLYFQSGEPIGEIPWDMIDQRGWSDFQAGVYRELTAIPHGETRTYAWISRRLGKLDRPAAPRAVGQALKRNPLPILIPCHRVCSEGGMGGFMGIADPEEPELQLKRWLIELETNYRNPVFCFLGAGVPLGFELSRAGATG